MSWGVFAAAALPYVASMFQDKPNAPGYRQVQMPDRSGYMNQLLRMGFDPNSQMYSRASDQLTDQVNRVLARQGLQGSSVGAQFALNKQAQFAQDMINEQLSRANQAMSTVSGYDINKAQVEAGIANAAYQAAMGQYNGQMQNQAQGIAGLSGLIGAGMNAYGQQQAQERHDLQRAQDLQYRQDLMNRAYPQQAAAAPPQMGVPQFQYSFLDQYGYGGR